MLGGFAHPFLATGDRPNLTRQPHLAVHHQAAVDGAGAQDRADRRQDRQIRTRLRDAHAADDVRVDVKSLRGDSGMPVENREQHVQAPLIDSYRQPPRRAGRLVDQRLNFHQQRTRAFAHYRHHAARDVRGSACEKDCRRASDLAQPAIRHREQADLVRGPEAILDRPDDAEPAVRLAFEVQHGVHHVFEHSWTGDGPVLGDVADEQHRNGTVLRVTDEPCRALAHLRHAARSGLQRFGEHRLDRIDHHDARRLALENVENGLHSRFGKQPHPVHRHSESPCPQRHLANRLLSGHVQDTRDFGSEIPQHLKQQRRFSDPRFPADEDDRSGHQSATEHPVELRRSRLDSRVRSEIHARCRDRPPGRHSRAHATGCLHPFLEGIPRTAVGTLTAPLPGARAALRARVDDALPDHVDSNPRLRREREPANGRV